VKTATAAISAALISDVLPCGALWYGEPTRISNAPGYATVSQPKLLNLFCDIRQTCEVKMSNKTEVRHAMEGWHTC
jgi:hypothetical protein